MRILGTVTLALLLQGCEIGFNYIAKPEHGEAMRETLRKIEKCQSIGMDANVYGGWTTAGDSRYRSIYYNVSCQEKRSGL